MALRDDILALRDGVWEGVVGHRTDHATVHAGLKNILTRMESMEGRANIVWVFHGTGTPSLSAFPGARAGDVVRRMSDGQEWRVDA